MISSSYLSVTKVKEEEEMDLLLNLCHDQLGGRDHHDQLLLLVRNKG